MPLHKPDAIVTDLDNTLLGPGQQIGPRDMAAIRHLRALGVPVVPGTGRPPIRVRSLAREMGAELALCSNGGCCYDFAREEMVFARLLDTGTARRLISWLTERGVVFILHTPPRTYRSPGAEVVPRYDCRSKGEEPLFLLTPETPLEELQILKILAVECDEKAVLREVQGAFPGEEISACISEPTFVDCNPPGVNKGDGLRQMAAAMSWRVENILALGDNYNDRPMLEAAGKSAVPASGVEEIKALAGFVTAPCGEDPLAAAVDHFYPGLLDGI